jgi:hypothetical protein
LVAWFVAVTVTPGTEAPDSSVMTPVIDAAPVWAMAGAARTSRTASRAITVRKQFEAMGVLAGEKER